jgi:hypothetical protein
LKRRRSNRTCHDTWFYLKCSDYLQDKETCSDYMYRCMYVFQYSYVHINKYVYIYLNVFFCIHIYIHAYTFKMTENRECLNIINGLCLSTYTWMHTISIRGCVSYIYTCIHIHLLAFIDIHIDMSACISTHIYTYLYVYMYIHIYLYNYLI